MPVPYSQMQKTAWLKRLLDFPAERRRKYSARKIQRAWRKRRGRRSYGSFRRKVNRAVLSKDPLQYTLQGFDVNSNPSLAAVSTTPQIIAAFSNVPFNNEIANAKFCRTSQKILAKNLSCQFEFAASDNYNKICMAFIRHKRSDPLINSELQAQGAGAVGPLTTLDNKPFLPCTQNSNHYYNTTPLNMDNLNPAAVANPQYLNDMWNPKVIEVIKTWNVQLQTPAEGATYPGLRKYTFFHKFNKTWKYQNAVSQDDTNRGTQTYNNQNYYLVAWSDSKVAAHPLMSLSYRLTYKDLD